MSTISSARRLLYTPARYSYLAHSMERTLSNNTIGVSASVQENAIDGAWAILGSGNIFSQAVATWRGDESHLGTRLKVESKRSTK
jgi:hypothetical protein